MKNVKAIELIEPAFGLQAGSVLTRTSNEAPFSIVFEHVGDNFQTKGETSVSESLINREIARPVEWFEQRKSAKLVISELEADVKMLSEKLELANSTIDKLSSTISNKIAEYTKLMEKIQNQLEDDVMSGEATEWADEAATVYYNLITLLKELAKQLN